LRKFTIKILKNKLKELKKINKKDNKEVLNEKDEQGKLNSKNINNDGNDNLRYEYKNKRDNQIIKIKKMKKKTRIVLLKLIVYFFKVKKMIMVEEYLE